MQKSNGMFYAPESSGKKVQVITKGEFVFSVIGLDHGHIYAMTRGLIEAGATPLFVYDQDPVKVEQFQKTFDSFKRANSKDEVLNDTSALVCSAIRPDLRFELGMQVLSHNKHYFTDKPGFLNLSELELVKAKTQETKKKYMIYFGERIHVEGAVLAQQMIDEGKLGDLISITILAPHRLSEPIRPAWFWKPEQNGGIIADIGSHQFEQFLSYAHAKSGKILCSAIRQTNKNHPDFQDYGQVSFVSDNNVLGFCRMDWFTPDGMGAWGDGRVFIVGTKGSLEIRKYLDVANSNIGDQLYFTDHQSETHIDAHGKTGFPFFGGFILDCMNNTELVMTQDHVLEAMRLALTAQEKAVLI